MSRVGAASRSLTLTEELEKLEQSITLTLQEIDGNFSKAHRIVTTSILPLVEEYAKHSSEVWEGSKFWKQFFEASANVSLSGYEEGTMLEDNSHAEDTSASIQTPTDREDYTGSSIDQQDEIAGEEEDEDEFTVDSPTQVTGVQTTPKLSPSFPKKMQSASRSQGPRSGPFTSPSPRKYTGKNSLGTDNSSDEPSTPRAQDVQAQSSPFEPESAYAPSALRQPPANNDPLMHRVLDKNYRVQSTPHTQRRERAQKAAAASKRTPATATKKALWEDSPQSSPAIAAPQLRSDLFSPEKERGPRTPGVSVLTPARHRPNNTGGGPTTSTGRKLFSPQDKTYAATQASGNRNQHLFSSPRDDDSSDDDFGMSPPKTMQFHIPQSRLVQTPAREASKKIVEDLLLTAGADDTDDIEGQDYEYDYGDEEEASPSVVRGAYAEDDTF